MNKKRIALLLVLMLLMTTVLVACNNDSTEPAETTETETTDTAAEETTEEVAEEETPEDEESVEDVQSVTDANTLVVGAPELNGSYINGFGNSTYDVWIKRVLGNYGGDLGYATTYYDEAGEFHVNPQVVEGEIETTENEDGTKTFRFKIAEDLVWSDGEPITAKDYVFSHLWLATPEWMMTGANNATAGEDLVGFDEFHDGTSTEFTGIELIDDYTFELTLKADKVPYFYETALIATSPSPLHRYAPNVDVQGSSLVVAEGYELTDEDRDALIETQRSRVEELQESYDTELQSYRDASEDYPQFNEENFADYEALTSDYETALEAEDTDPEYKTMLGQYGELQEAQTTLSGYEDGSIEVSPLQTLLTTATNEVAYEYRFKPDVTAGPYKFVEMANNMAKVTINENFKGDAEGNLPTIQNVVVQTVNQKIDVDLAIAGTIDIVPGVIEGEKIDKAKNSTDSVGANTFARNGYGLLQTITDQGPTQYKGVRQAIAYSLDRNEFVQTIAGGYGTVVNGAFGVAQFEYQELGADFNEQAINYTRNAEMANQALDTTPYTFEADGTTPWDPAKAEEMYNSNPEGFDYFRHDAEGNPLRVIHEGSTQNDVSDLIAGQLPDNTKVAGIQYIFNAVDFATLLDHYYYPDPEDPDAPTVFNMGTGFAIPNDPYYSYHSSQIDTGDNRNRVNDPELDPVLVGMRNVTPEDRDAWLEGWLQFQLWYNDNLPNIPLYANEYYDIHTNRVQNVNTTPMHDWSDLICTLELAE